MKRELSAVVLGCLLVALCAVSAYAVPNPAAAYAEVMGYEYSNDNGGTVTIPGTGETFSAWDFFRGKVGSEYAYGEQYGYDTVNRTETEDGCTRSYAVCVPKKAAKDAGATEIPLEDLMRENGEPLWDEALQTPPSEMEILLERANRSAPLKTFPKQELPSSFDWRDVSGESYIGSVRNQGSCGSCYAFGAAAAAEGTFNYAMGQTDGDCVDFSEAYIAWCLGEYGDYSSHFAGCDGADYDYQELEALTVEGICGETQMPYNSGSDPGSCTYSGTTTVFDAWARVDYDDIDAIKTAIMTYGVVDAAVYVDSAFDSYSSGVHDDSNNDCDSGWYTTSNHAISLVGWDDNPPEGGGGVFILRNSWGTSWGESGYMRIRTNAAVVHCAVCYMVYTPSSPVAPAFGANPGPVTTTNGSETSFTVSASGYPTPGLVLHSTTASSGYSFTAGTGELTYTAPLADVGSRNFVFYATNSAGTATQTVSVTVMEAPPSAPASIWANPTNMNDFTANWSAVSNATGYRLDVSTNAGFSVSEGGGGVVILGESMDSGLASSYTTGEQTLTSGVWYTTAVYQESSTESYGGTGHAARLNDDTSGAGIRTPALNTCGSITFWYREYNSGGGDFILQKSYDDSTWINVATQAFSGTTYTQFSNNVNDSASTIYLRVLNDNQAGHLIVDEVEITSYGSSTPDYVPGYSNLTVAGTSQSVTGLTAGTTYYFRARAVSGGGTSVNSPAGSVTTIASLSAPVFGANPGPESTTESVETSFIVSATGNPTPTLSLAGTTASSGYNFTAGTGELTYTPPIGDAGAQTFTFSSVNSEGSDSQIVTVNVTAATAPAFTGGFGPYSTTAGVEVAFSVTASGNPAAILALESTTASTGYAFNAGTGAFSYTPPVADVGTPTFTFTAANAAGTVTQVTSVTVASIPKTPPTVDPISPQAASTYADFEYTVTATEADGDSYTFACSSAVDTNTWLLDENTGDFLFVPTENEIGSNSFSFTATDVDGTSDPVVMVVTVSESLPDAPASIWASATNDVDFTAAWSAVDGATGYRLDVSTNAGFAVGGSAVNLMSNEGFETGDTTDWDTVESGYTVTTTLPHAGSYCMECVATSTRDLDQQVAIPAADGSTAYIISYWYRITAGDGSDVRIWASWDNGTGSGDTLQPGTYNTDTTNWTQIVLTNTPASGATNLDFEVRCYSGSTVYLDDYSVMEAGGSSSVPDYVPGYSNLTVAGTSQSVTGLTAESAYYFRARAVNGAGTSSDSPTGSVTTLSEASSDQTITFPAISDQTTTDTVGLYATASSGLEVTFAVGSGPASITGSTNLSFTGAGTVSIVASQAGDGSWNPAPDVTNTFTVSKALATVTLSDLSHMYDGSAKSATVSTTPTGLTVNVTYDGSGSAPSAVGTYEVIAIVSDTIYAGGVTDTFEIVTVTNVFEEWLETEQGQSSNDPAYAPDADEDGDGATTWEEFLADTDPSSAGSCLVLTGAYAIATVSNGTGDMVLTFPASPDRYYRLEYCTDLLNHLVGTNDLGWGQPGMAVTNSSTGTWYGVIRVFLQEP